MNRLPVVRFIGGTGKPCRSSNPLAPATILLLLTVSLPCILSNCAIEKPLQDMTQRERVDLLKEMFDKGMAHQLRSFPALPPQWHSLASSQMRLDILTVANPDDDLAMSAALDCVASRGEECAPIVVAELESLEHRLDGDLWGSSPRDAAAAATCFSQAAAVAWFMMQAGLVGSGALRELLKAGVSSLGSLGWLHPTWKRWPMTPALVRLTIAIVDASLDNIRLEGVDQSLVLYLSFASQFLDMHRAVGSGSDGVNNGGGRICDEVDAAISVARAAGDDLLATTFASHADVLLQEPIPSSRAERVEQCSDNLCSKYTSFESRLQRLTRFLDLAEAREQLRQEPSSHNKDWWSFHRRLVLGTYSEGAMRMSDTSIRQHAHEQLARGVAAGALVTASQFYYGEYGPVGEVAEARRDSIRAVYDGSEHPAIAKIRRLLREEYENVATVYRRFAKSAFAWSFAEPSLHNISDREWEQLVMVDSGDYLRADFLSDDDPAEAGVRIMLRQIHSLVPISQVKFSRIRGGSRVSPHVGSHGLGLRHLLTIDNGCDKTSDAAWCVSLKVGLEGREMPYIERGVVTFDDSYLHYVHSDGPRNRYRTALLVETLNPLICGGDLALGMPRQSCKGAWWPYEKEVQFVNENYPPSPA